MNCEAARLSIDAWIDNELNDHDRDSFETHLASCDECRKLAEDRRSEHDLIWESMAPDRLATVSVADRVVSQLPQSRPTTPVDTHGRVGWSTVIGFAVGLAVGVLIMLPLLDSQPDSDSTGTVPGSGNSIAENPAIENPISPVGTLNLVSGPVEFSPMSTNGWTSCEISTDVSPGFRVRTGANGQCELSLNQGAVVRLNHDTELAFENDGTVRLQKGQLWMQRPLDAQQSAPRVSTGGHVVEVDGTCDVQGDPNNAQILVCSGTATISGPDGQETLKPGEVARVGQNQPLEKDTEFDPILATRWVHDLLIMKNATDPETTDRIQRLWGALGNAKLRYLYEEELRALGAHCSVPLFAFLEESSPQSDGPKRERAARILADVATYDTIPLLVQLLEDPQPDVRYESARGLERLTGRNFGLANSAWRDAPRAACGPALNKWQQWLDTKRVKTTNPDVEMRYRKKKI